MRIKNEGIFRSARIQAVRSLQVDSDTDSQLLDQLLSYLGSNDDPLLLEYLEFGFTNLSSLSCEILAAGVCQVQEVVCCWNAVITTEQLDTLFTTITTCSQPSLRKLKLCSNTLSG